jgi:RNA polymerase sigma-70 factor (ECF subfamily)
MTDEEAIGRVLGGDLEAFRALVETYQGPVFRIVRLLAPDPHAAEDTAQEVFLAAFLHLRDFDPARGRFPAWLFALAKNRALDARKKRAPCPAEVLDPVAKELGPGDRAAGREFFERLDRALDCLPPEQRDAFVLHEMAGLTGEEIAGIEGVEPGTVRSRVSRAKAQLRASLSVFSGKEP